MNPASHFKHQFRNRAPHGGFTWLQGAQQPGRAPGDAVALLEDAADDVADPSRALLPLPLPGARPRPPAAAADGGEPLLPHGGNRPLGQLIARFRPSQALLLPLLYSLPVRPPRWDAPLLGRPKKKKKNRIDHAADFFR